ncbi:MAG: LytR/AlgR family response regulator transcription factor, partial [Bryobacteraceae bacterium]
ADGLAALESIAALHPDAVFLDVQMRAVAKLRDTGTRNGLDRLMAALQKGQSIQRVVGKKLRQLHVLAIDTVEAFVADEDLVFAITADGRFLVEKTLRELEAALDPERFARVHKQAIVNLGKIGVLEPLGKGGATLRLQSGGIVAIGRRYTADLRRKLDW